MELKEIKPKTKTTSLTDQFTELSKIREGYKDKLGWIRDNLAPSLNDEEILLFLLRSKHLGLNPLNGEIFAYASGGKGARKVVTIIARDGKRRLAAKTGELKTIASRAIYNLLDDGYTKAVQPWEGGKLWGASCTIVKKDGSEFTVAVPLSEYTGNRGIWASKPETMIKKVAESQCLSMAFPELLSGVYDESERFDNNGSTPELEDGGKPATPAQIKTIETLGSEVQNDLTKQEAADMITDLAKKEKKK